MDIYKHGLSLLWGIVLVSSSAAEESFEYWLKTYGNSLLIDSKNVSVGWYYIDIAINCYDTV